MVWWLAVPYFVILGSQLSVNFWMPTIMKDSLHLTNQQVGWLTGAISVVGMAGMLFNGWWSDRTEKRVLHNVGPLLLVVAGGLIAAIASDPRMVVFGLALVIWGHNTMMPAFWCLPSLFLSGVGAAAGIALINSVGNLGGFFGPNLIGSVKTATGGYSAAFLVIAGAALVAAIVTMGLRGRSELSR
jgi:ACS family tartrate transporter-like MFS transporter